MSRTEHEDILIIGAGPAGLAAAVFLRTRGVSVAIVDPRDWASDDRFAVVLHGDALHVLGDVGVAFERGEARAIERVTIDAADGRRTEVDLLALPSTQGPAAVAPHWLLCKKLEAALAATGTHVHWSHRLGRIAVDPAKVHAEIETLDADTGGYAVESSQKAVVRTRRHEPAYLIGADGRDSAVRAQLDIELQPLGPPEEVAVFEVDTDTEHAPELRVVVGDAVVTTWPLLERGARIAFHLPTAVAAPELTGGEPDAAALSVLLARHAPELGIAVRAVRGARVLVLILFGIAAVSMAIRMSRCGRCQRSPGR